MVSLDGSNRIVATEFIKLEITGTSNLATEQYVNTAIINGGGGGTGTTDLTNYYNKTETDALLNNKYSKSETDTLLNDKLNINNPQDMSGTLRLGHIDGLSKIILNGVASSKDFYVNGDGEINGNHLVASLDSSGYIKGSNIQSNTFNALNTNDILFQSNSDTYIQYDVSESKIVASKIIQSGGYVKTQEIDTIAPLDLIIRRNNVSMIELQDNLTVLNTKTQCENFIVCDNFESKNASTIINHIMNESTGEIKFYVGSPIVPDTTNLIMTLKNGIFEFNKPTNLDLSGDTSNCLKLTGETDQQVAGTVAVNGAKNGSNILTVNGASYFSNNLECVNNILCDYIESKNASTIMNYVMNESTGEIKFYVGSPTVPDATTNLVMTLQNNLITFHKPTSPDIGGGGVDDSNLVKYTGETLQTIEGDLVIGGGSQFSTYDLTLNGATYFNATIEFPLGGAINLGTGKGYIRSINIGSGNAAYDYCIFGSAGVHRFYIGGSPFPQHLKFQLSNTQAYFNVDVVCHTELQTDIINTKNATDVDLVFKRGDVEYMKFEGTLQTVELTKGAKSNTYDSIGNVDVSFRRNTIDFMYFRNGNVEVNTGISLLAESGKFDVIDSATPTNVVFRRGGVNFFTLDGTKNIIDVSTGRALSSQYIYGDYFYNRNFGADMVFQGSNTTDDGLAEYMRYRKVDEDVNFSKDIYVNQDKKAYFHRETGKNSYIVNENTAGVNHFKLINEDPNGDIRFYANGGIRLFVTPSKVSVPAPYTLEGDLVDTSQKDMKYDIEEADFNFTKIVNSIKPHTFKMKEEKEMGITKTHIGFIAEEVEENIPEKVENILVKVDGIKKLSYVKMNSILWGCVREQQQKIEHLESRLFEVENFIKDYVKPKPKPKAKAKGKEKIL